MILRCVLINETNVYALGYHLRIVRDLVSYCISWEVCMSFHSVVSFIFCRSSIITCSGRARLKFGGVIGAQYCICLGLFIPCFG